MKILFLSAEVAPFAKMGGLADVAGSLPKALAKLGHDVRVFLPAYGSIEHFARIGKFGIRPHPLTLHVPLGHGQEPAGLFETTLPGSDVPVYFVASWNHFGGRPWLYGYKDDPYRFAFFSRAALDAAVAAMHWRPDVVHAHDWHTAPAVAWLATAGQADPRYAAMPTVFTIHNLMHQGTAPWQIFDYLGLITHRLAEERYGEVNFMARGIQHATMINTVSPNYAREILTYEGGCGMDAILKSRSFDVHGILNGLDFDVWDPAADKHLAATFDSHSVENRNANRRALQQRAGLPIRDDVPIVAMVTRIDHQKGFDITGHVLHRLMNNEAGETQFIILGSGDHRFENMMRSIADYHREKMKLFLGYDPELAPLIYGGSDVFLMPSLFEPCGLGQLIAMRYGSVPVVREVGGLTDTVREPVTGFSFVGYNADEFWNALARALYTYRNHPDQWSEIQHNGMTADFTWQTSAERYQELYQWAISRGTGK